MLEIYGSLRIELDEGVEHLKSDIMVYEKQFYEKGPLVKDLLPAEAAERYDDYFTLVNVLLTFFVHFISIL